MEYLALGLAVIVIIKLILIRKYRKIIKQQVEEIRMLQEVLVNERESSNEVDNSNPLTIVEGFNLPERSIIL